MSPFNYFSVKNLKGDIFGGVTAAIVSLPLALAFGIASGAGAEAGIYGALLIGLFASLFGGTPTLISEPTGPMTVVMAAVLTHMQVNHPENGLAMAFTVVMIAGIFQILFGSLKLGKYITLMPYSVISGFMSGIGIILIILQLAPMLGSPSPPGGVIGTLEALPELLLKANGIEILLFIATLGVLYFLPEKYKKRVPPQLVALIGISFVAYLLIGDGYIQRIGEIEIGMPSMVTPTFTASEITTMFLDGMVLGMLGCIDSMLTSMIADNLTNTEHKSDKELIGQGLGNLMSGLFGGLPGAGATMGTVVNIQSGAKSALSGVTRVIVLFVAVFGAANLIEVVPLAVLAGIALMVGVNILDWSFIKRAHKVSWQSSLIMYAVMFLTVFVDLIVAVGVGIFVANIIIIEKLSRAQQQSIKAISEVEDAIRFDAQERSLMKRAESKVLLVYLSGPMIFGVAKVLSRQHQRIAQHQGVIIDLTDVSMLDDTISLAIENTAKYALSLDKALYVVVKTSPVREKLERLGLLGLIPTENVTDNRAEALSKAINCVEEWEESGLATS